VRQTLIVPWLPTCKQEFCSPSLQPSRRCKTHAFLPARTPPSRRLFHTMTTLARLPGLYHRCNFILTWQALPVYRDFATETTLEWHENSCPFIKSLPPWQLHHDMTNVASLPGLAKTTLRRKAAKHNLSRFIKMFFTNQGLPYANVSVPLKLPL